MKVFFFIAVFTLATFSARAKETEPVPPPMVAGFADGNGNIGIFAGLEGGVDGVNLATGKRVWTSREGVAPLHSTFGWVAVASPAPGPALRIRFLRTGDGKVFGKPALLKLPSWVDLGVDVQADEAGASFNSAGISVSVSVWSPLPSRNPDREPRAGKLRLKWHARKSHQGGEMPSPGAFKSDSGQVFVDPASGAVENAAPGSRDFQQPANPELYPNWKPEKNHLYSSNPKYGSTWSNKPGVFRIGGTISAYLAYEEPGKRLFLQRWRPGKLLSPLEISRGKMQTVFVSLEGDHLVLMEFKAGSESLLLVDLIRSGGNPQTLARLESGYRAPILVMNQKLFYVTETRGKTKAARTEIERILIAMDPSEKNKSWTHRLASRFEYALFP